MPIAIDEGHTGPAEVAYFHPGDAAEAATLAFWLGRVLHQSPPATRLQRSPDAPRRIVAWLDR